MLVVVGGHSRNIGKTGVMAGIIRSLPGARWTAIKITQHGHGVCSAEGEPCDCAVTDSIHPYALSQEFEPDERTDSGRYLAAGARESYWLRTPVGQLDRAMPVLRRILASSENAIVESNSVLEFLEPDLYLMVLDYSVKDFKESSRRFLERADALVIVERAVDAPGWTCVDARALEGKPRFRITPPAYMSRDLLDFVRARLERTMAGS